MLDPVTVFKGVDSIVKAVETIDKLLADREKLAADDASYYNVYVSVAATAIKALEDEYIQILLNAASLDVNDEKERKELKDRINRLIYGETLRPKLKDAILHLREGRKALEQHSERLLIWPSVRDMRNQALTKYVELVNALDSYHAALGGPTGPTPLPLVSALFDIQHHLEHPEGNEALLQSGTAGPSALPLKEFAGYLLMNLDKSQVIEITGRCARAIEVLRIAFR